MGNKMIKLLPIILLVVILASGCGSSTPQSAPPPTTPPPSEGIDIGSQAIDFQLQTLDGQTVKLSDLRGKPVLLNFWATWCPPCRFEMPFLQQINDSYSAKGLVLLAIDIGESPGTVQKFMTEFNLSLTVPMDTDSKVAKSYGITAIPTTFLIDKNGVIQFKLLGAFPNKEAIETALTKIIP